ncbi:uncharacterized protein LOC143038856 isoform X2 [Oratosquilla oratoria]
MHNEVMETCINVSSFIPCTSVGSFYSGAGRISEEKMKAYLTNEYENVIGWFRYRRSNSLEPFLRECLIHKQLAELVGPKAGHFVLCLVSNPAPLTEGTITVHHRFMTLKDGHLEGLPVQILSMQDTSTSDYRQQPVNPGIYSSSAVQSAISSISGVEAGLQEMKDLHAGLVGQLHTLLPKMSTANHELHQLQQEVMKLRKFCHEKKLNPDFTPDLSVTEETKDLMDFKEVSSAPAPKEEEVRKGVQNKGSTKIKGTTKGRKAKQESSDPFSFVNNEMEKLQVHGKGNTKVHGNKLRAAKTQGPAGRGKAGSKTISNTRNSGPKSESGKQPTSRDGSPVADQKKGKESREASPSQSSNSHSPSPASPRMTKQQKMLRYPSKERQNSALINKRGDSPSASHKVVKSKVKEAWASRTASDSQEF